MSLQEEVVMSFIMKALSQKRASALKREGLVYHASVSERLPNVPLVKALLVVGVS